MYQLQDHLAKMPDEELNKLKEEDLLYGWILKNEKSIERIIEEKLKLEELVVEILSDAAYAERFISKPNNNRCPSMYKLLDFIRERKDIGFYDRPKLILRATPRQMTRWFSFRYFMFC